MFRYIRGLIKTDTIHSPLRHNMRLRERHNSVTGPNRVGPAFKSNILPTKMSSSDKAGLHGEESRNVRVDYGVYGCEIK